MAERRRGADRGAKTGAGAHPEDAERDVEPQENRPHYHSHALSRGLGLLGLVAAGTEPVTLAEMHGATGHPKSTLVRLLAVLEAEDYVIRVDERPAFVLGHGVLPIVSGYLSSRSLADVLRPYVRTIAQETGWTTNVGVLESGRVYHLCVEYPDRPLRFVAPEGSYADAYCSGLGKALLAELADANLPEHLPDEPFPTRTEQTLASLAALRADLEQVRARGYAIDDEENARGLRCVAVPMRAGEQVVGALSVSGAAGELDADGADPLAARLREVAAQMLDHPQVRSALTITARSGVSRVQ